MKNKGIAVATACAIGAGLGTLLALNFGVFWPLGILLGGIAGYFTYDYPQVLTNMKTAWKSTVDVKNWKGIPKKIRVVRLIILAIILTFQHLALYMQYALPEMDGSTSSLLEVCALLFGTVLTTISIFVNAQLIIGYYEQVGILKYPPLDEGEIRTDFLKVTGIAKILQITKRSLLLTTLASILTPVYAVFVSLVFILMIAYLVVKNLWLGIEALLKFLWKFFVLIHSDLRLLIGIDSLMGGLAGFYFGEIWIGMLAGFVWGAFNYWIVSIKILNLKHS